MNGAYDDLLLAAVLHGGDLQDVNNINADSFYSPRASDVWNTLVELTDQGETPTVETVAAHQGPTADEHYLAHLIDTDADPADTADYATKVAEGAARRVMVDIAHQINHAADTDQPYDETYDTAIETLEALPKHFAYRKRPVEDRPPEPPYVDGGSFIFDIPDTIPAIWGEGQDVLWAKGEALTIVGSSGVGKTTLTGQVTHGLLFGGHLLGLPIQP